VEPRSFKFRASVIGGIARDTIIVTGDFSTDSIRRRCCRRKI